MNNDSLLDRLIDYAGLFPPASLGMGEALDEYRDAAAGRFAWMLGPFLCPARRLGELLVTLAGKDHTPLPLGAIMASVDDLPLVASWVEGASTVRLEQVELPMPDDMSPIFEHLAHLEPPPQVYLEVRTDQASTVPRPDAIEVCGKVRCGGATADAFPTPEMLAGFVTAAVSHRLSFKATAGLHHSFRHFDETIGAWQHGFVNLIAAVQASVGGADLEDVVAVLEITDGERFRFGSGGGLAWVGGYDDVDPAAVRAVLRSYGSCSFSEPTHDLVSAGLLTPDGTLAAP
ncbi:MAG: hypothetical protein ACRD29_07910 [Acidimicrobiales bacterium]